LARAALPRARRRARARVAVGRRRRAAHGRGRARRRAPARAGRDAAAALDRPAPANPRRGRGARARARLLRGPRPPLRRPADGGRHAEPSGERTGAGVRQLPRAAGLLRPLSAGGAAARGGARAAAALFRDPPDRADRRGGAAPGGRRAPAAAGPRRRDARRVPQGPGRALDRRRAGPRPQRRVPRERAQRRRRGAAPRRVPAPSRSPLRNGAFTGKRLLGPPLPFLIAYGRPRAKTETPPVVPAGRTGGRGRFSMRRSSHLVAAGLFAFVVAATGCAKIESLWKGNAAPAATPAAKPGAKTTPGSSKAAVDGGTLTRNDGAGGTKSTRPAAAPEKAWTPPPAHARGTLFSRLPKGTLFALRLPDVARLVEAYQRSAIPTFLQNALVAQQRAQFDEMLAHAKAELLPRLGDVDALVADARRLQGEFVLAIPSLDLSGLAGGGAFASGPS